jgi:hypothetical protein
MFRTRLTGFVALAASLLLLVGISSATGATAKKNLTLPKLPTMVATTTTVKLTPGKWSLPAKLTYQWLLDGSPIKKATTTSYVVPVTALNHNLAVVETAKFSDGKSLFAISKNVMVGLLVTSGQALLTKDDVHSKLVFTTPALPSPSSVSAITWYAGGSLVEGAKTNELAIDKRFDSLSVYAKVSYTQAGFNPLVLTSNSISFAAPGVTSNTLLWSDEFDGTVGSGPSAAAWNDVTGNGRNYNDPYTPVANGWGNLEREYYLPGASLISSMNDASDGKGLLITATNQSVNPNPAGPFDCWYSLNWKGQRYNPRKDCEWVSGKISTENKLGFLYGHLEARIKTTGTAGTWPAFWMLGQDFQTNSWPGCGEIDIHEGNGALPNSNWGTIHGYNYWPGGQVNQSTSMIAGWHVYGLDWKPNYIAFSVDGVIYKTITASDLQTTPWNLNLEQTGWEFNKPQFAILNLAVGGKIIGNNNNPVRTQDITTDTKTMQVDYIRYSTLDGYGTLIRY